MESEKRARGRPKSFHPKTAQNTIQSLDRALDVLDSLAASSGLTLSEVAAELDQSPATIYRVLSTLEARGIAEVDAAQQTWHIGPSTFRLGSAFLRRSSVVERSRPYMRTLMEQTGETSNLGIQKSDTVMFLSQVETHESIRAFFPPGTQSPMHASGIGKALLSCYSEEQVITLLRKSTLEQFTDRTIVERDALLQELRTIRDQGYSFDDEERTMGMRCIAAPITNFYGEAVAGISISGPTHRVTENRINEIAALVKDAAYNLSLGMGAQTEAAP